MENNQSHKFGANITLYNIARKGFLLLSRIFIWIYPVFFAVTKFPSETSIYLSVSTNEPCIKSGISGVIRQVASESKIQPVSWNLSPEYLLGLLALGDICDTYAYIFCDLLSSVLFSEVLSIFLDL